MFEFIFVYETKHLVHIKFLVNRESIQYGFDEPRSLTEDSTTLIINLINGYSNLKCFDQNLPKLKSKKAVYGIIAGLRCVYRDDGRVDTSQEVQRRAGETEMQSSIGTCGGIKPSL